MERQMKLDRIRELTGLLNRASYAYYQQGNEIMPNIEYDRLYDELDALEKETGFSLSSSPTKNVGYEVLSELPKEAHASPMLSLDKTKSEEALADWLGDKKGVLSWKMDGLTIVLTYENGMLQKAVTRGNGEIGEVITGNARCFEDLPVSIDYKGRLVLRGEAVISYSSFEKINASIADADAKYKNPRNLCSGSVRQLDPSVTRARHVMLRAFTLVESELEFTSYKEQLDFLAAQGFSVVENVVTDAQHIRADIDIFRKKVGTNDLPSDGLVLFYDDLAYGRSLGRTAKFPRNGIAFKWKDETAETVLRSIDWSVSRTGLINPVAVFDPVELEGTTVTRASVHNLSIIEELGLGIGDTVTVYKANMIIPQIAENLTRSGLLAIPQTCPVCGAKTEVRKDNDAAYLYCTGADCPAKKIKAFTLMVSRDALNIDGLSEMTLADLIGEGFIKSFADLFRLERFREQIVRMEGLGEKSFANLVNAAERAKNTEMHRMLYGLGIPGIGLQTAKMISRHFGNSYDRIKNAQTEELLAVDGVGKVLAESFTAYFADERRLAESDELAELLHFPANDPDAPDFVGGAYAGIPGGGDGAAAGENAAGASASGSGAAGTAGPGAAGRMVTVIIGGEERSALAGIFSGKTFVVTGDVHIFKNRRELTDLVEKLGGRASSSVSSKTDYLVNNDIMSSSSKNKKARELSIPVISEEDFIGLLG